MHDLYTYSLTILDLENFVRQQSGHNPFLQRSCTQQLPAIALSVKQPQMGTLNFVNKIKIKAF